MITMFYDDKCPVCRTEAQHLHEKSPNKITIVAVDDAVATLTKAGISHNDAMTYLCVQDNYGHIQTGMAAVRLLYQTAELPFATALSLPLIKQASEIIYPIFARNRNRVPRWVIKLVYGHLAADCTDGRCKVGNNRQ